MITLLDSLNDILRVPTITKNLISVSKFSRDNNVFFEFHSHAWYVKSQVDGRVLLEGKVSPDGLYVFHQFRVPVKSTSATCLSVSIPCNSVHDSSCTSSTTQCIFLFLFDRPLNVFLALNVTNNVGVVCQTLITFGTISLVIQMIIL